MITAWVLAFLGTVGIQGIMAVTQSRVVYTNSFFAVIIFGLSAYVQIKIVPAFFKSTKRDKIYSGAFSLLVSMALHLGARLEAADNVNVADAALYINIIFLAIYLAPIVCTLWNKADDLFDKFCVLKEEKKLKLTTVWLIIFLLWIPTLLALFPGAFVYDATDEYVEVITREFTMHHPLLHVLLLGGIVHAAEYIGLGANAGIAIYMLLQMAAVSLVAAIGIVKLQKWGANKKYCLGAILFIGLFPVFPMYAVCSAKDTLFTAAFFLSIIMLIDYTKDYEKFFDKRMVIFVASSVVMMLLRNNGVYAYMVAIPFIALCQRGAGKKFRIYGKILILMMISFVLYEGANASFKIATHATDNEHQEILTVPIQQLARVYTYAPETFTSEEVLTLYEVLPENYLITYNPRCSDILKSGFDNEAYAKDSAKYRKLWADIGKRKPLIYLNAWLVNSYGYWYPDMVINVYGGNQVYTFRYEDSSYFGFETEPPGTRNSLFPPLERFYRAVSLEIFQQKVPILSMLFAPGFMFYVFAFAFFKVMRDKKWNTLSALIPVALLWCTVLLGPTVLVRYVLILWFMAVTLPIIANNRKNA